MSKALEELRGMEADLEGQENNKLEGEENNVDGWMDGWMDG